VILAVAAAGANCLTINHAAADETAEQKYTVAVERIWDRAGHSAFTDLIAADGYLYCTFREGSGHIPGLNGAIRVIRSRDAATWESVALLAEQHVDLRDPKLSIAPDGRLMINCGASYYHGSKRLKIESRVAFSTSDGSGFGEPQKVILPEDVLTGGDWLWRVTWHKGIAWGCVQQIDGNKRALWLVQSKDGVRYSEVARLAVDGPSETTLRFLPDETMAAMIRCESGTRMGKIGTAKPPYREWSFVDSNKRFGGPNFVQLPRGAFLAGSRQYGAAAQTALWSLDMETGRMQDLLTLPSGGDNSYPGFVVDQPGGRIYVSYYSSHEGKAAIYLATLRLDEVERSLRASD
jgi:hypothetical protein